MKVQRLIEKYKKLEGVWDAEGAELARQIFLQDLEQLDEPEKVVVPQLVADWYEENKDDFEGNLFRCVHNIPSIFDGAKLNEFEKWFINTSTKPFQILVNMHQFGYEVDKEKRYRISMPKARNYKNHAHFLCEKDSKMFWCAEWYSHRTKFARKELEEAGFGWVFDCPGIEIEEVSD